VDRVDGHVHLDVAVASEARPARRRERRTVAPEAQLARLRAGGLVAAEGADVAQRVAGPPAAVAR
jgi:hypothetical protein